jgi:hypothetical protein
LYARAPALDFSDDLLRKCPGRLQFLNVPPCGWIDVGTPERLAEILRRFRFSAPRTFNLATAFDRAVFKQGNSPASMIESNHAQFGQVSFVPSARFPRLSPNNES